MINQGKIKFREWVYHDQNFINERGEFSTKDFFDREQEKHLIEVLKGKSRVPVVIYGARRSGKTSLMRYLANCMSQEGAIPIILPMYMNSYDQLVKNLIYRTAAELGIPRRAYPALPDGMSIPEVRQALRTVIPADLGKTILICLDEMDSLIRDSKKHEVQSQILSLLNDITEENGLPIRLMATAIRQHAIDDITPYSPLLHKAEKALVTPFQPDFLDEMVRSILEEQLDRITPADMDALYHLSGGWPYFAKLLLHSAAEAKIEIRPGWVEQIMEEDWLDTGELESAITHIYNKQFSQAEQILFLLTARQGRVTQKELDILDQLSNGISTAGAYFLQIGLFQLENGALTFRVGLLPSWIQKKWSVFRSECNKQGIDRLIQDIRTTSERLERQNKPAIDLKTTVIDITDDDVANQ